MGLSDLERKAMREAIYDEAGMAISEGKSMESYRRGQVASGAATTGFSAGLTGAGLGATIAGAATGGIGAGLGALIGGAIGTGVGALFGGTKEYMESSKEYDRAKKAMRAQAKEARRQDADAKAYGRRSQSKRAQEIERSYLAASNPSELDVNASSGISGYDAFKARTYGG